MEASSISEKASTGPQAFCGIIATKYAKGEGMDVVLAGSGYRIHIASSKDPGLAYLPNEEQRHFVVEAGRIIAVYIRPRVRLLKLAGSGDELTDGLLWSLKPIYPHGIGRLQKKAGRRSRRLRMYLLQHELAK